MGKIVKSFKDQWPWGKSVIYHILLPVIILGIVYVLLLLLSKILPIIIPTRYDYIIIFDRSGNLFFWLFSSIFQGTAALLAVVTAVSVFKIQTHSKKVDELNDFVKTEFADPQKRMEFSESIRGSLNDDLNGFVIRFKIFFIFTSIVAVVSLILLVFSNYFAGVSDRFDLLVLLVFFVISLVISSLVSLFNLVKEIFKI